MKTLFLSRSQRERETEGLQRAAIRRADRTVRNRHAEVERMKLDRNRVSGEAKACIRAGNEPGARSYLSAVQSIDIDIDRAERRIRVIEHHVRRARSAHSDRESVTALAGLDAAVGIEPERIGSVLDNLADKEALERDAEAEWTTAHDWQMEGNGVAAGKLPSIDQMLASLHQEVAADIEAETDRTSAQSAELDATRQRLKDLLESSK